MRLYLQCMTGHGQARLPLAVRLRAQADRCRSVTLSMQSRSLQLLM